MSLERVAPDSHMNQGCNYGNRGEIERCGAAMDGESREPRIFGRQRDGCFWREAPILPRRKRRLTRRPAASTRAADKFVYHPPDHALDGIFFLRNIMGQGSSSAL
jgi:hypothetical protein